MSEHGRHIILLESLLDELQDQYFPMGVGVWLRVSKLLELSAERGDDVDTIRFKLAAILTKSPEEQKRFFEIFDEWLARHAYRPEPPPPPPRSGWWGRNWLAITLTLAFLVLGSVFSYWYIGNKLMGVKADISLLVRSERFEVKALAKTEVQEYPPFLRDSVVSMIWEWDGLYAGEGELLQTQIRPNQEPRVLRLLVKTARGFEATAKQNLEQKHFDLSPGLEISVSNNQLEAKATAKPLQSEWTLAFGGGGRTVVSLLDSTSRARLKNAKLLDAPPDLGLQRRNYRWEFGDGNFSSEPEPMHRYQDSGEFIVKLFTESWVQLPDSLYRIEDTVSQTIQVPQIESLPPVPLSEKSLALPDIRELLKPQKSNLLLLWLSLLALVLYALYELIRYRRQKVVLDANAERGPPIQKHLKVDLPDTQLFRSEVFDDAATQLRIRRLGTEEELDIPATLDATIAQAGIPDFQFRTLTQASQYLVLIDQSHSRDHQARLYMDLVRELNDRDISAAYYFYDKDPSLCWKKGEDPATQVALAQLQSTYFGERLIVVGTGDGWLDPYSSDWAEWTNWLQFWPEKALLSTRPTGKWGRKERVLAERFVVVPATQRGLQELVPQWQAEEAMSPREWRYEAFEVAPNIPRLMPTPLQRRARRAKFRLRPLFEEGTANGVSRGDVSAYVSSLRHYLGEDRFQWLCACALYPHLYYELTLQLGEMILGPELTLEAVGHLFRLPWFQEGMIPVEIRPALVKELTEENAQGTRTYLMELMQQDRNLAPKGSFAEQEQTSTLAIYQYLNSERKDEDREALKEALAGMEWEDFEDQVSLSTLADIKGNPLAIVLPRRFFKGGIPFMGTKFWARAGGFAATLALLWGLMWGFGYRFQEELPQPPYEQEDVVLVSAEDSLRWEHHRGLQLALAGQEDSARKVLREAVLRGMTDELINSDLAPGFWLGLNLDFYKLHFNQVVKQYHREAYREASIGVNELITFYSNPFLEADAVLPLRRLEDRYAGNEALAMLNDTLFPTRIASHEYYYVSGLIGLFLEQDEQVIDPVFRLNRPDSNYYHSPDSNAYTQEKPASEEVLRLHLDRLWRANPDPELALLYAKLGLTPPRTEGADDGRSGEDEAAILADTLLVVVERYSFGQYDIIGRLSIDGVEQCLTLEDPYQREKIPNQTAIPAGTYKLALRTEGSRDRQLRDRFPDDHQGVLWIQEVPDFTLVYLHPGNNADDTQGSVLVGTSLMDSPNQAQAPPQGRRTLLNSSSAYQKVYPTIATHLAAGKPALLRIVDRPDETNPDTDGDGILDYRDECPDEAGFARYFGCPAQTSPEQQTEEGSDEVLVRGYVGWDLAPRIPVSTATVNLNGVQTTTTEGGTFTFSVPKNVLEQQNLSLTIDRKDFATYTDYSFRLPVGDTVLLDTFRLRFAAAPPEMVEIKGGTFLMGAAEDDPEAEDNEKPQHEVTLSDFAIGKYEVTVAQYLSFVQESGYDLPDYMGSQSGNFHPDQPVIGVSWDDAQAYIQWLGKRTGVAYRLPTEAQWEYAARGGEAYRYAGSDDPGAVAWYSANANNQTHVVGGKAPNGYGLYDMSGNVYEWCQDWYGEYSRRNAKDPQGPARGTPRVVRGGNWGVVAWFCRVSYRYRSSPGFRNDVIGFRLARG